MNVPAGPIVVASGGQFAIGYNGTATANLFIAGSSWAGTGGDNNGALRLDAGSNSGGVFAGTLTLDANAGVAVNASTGGTGTISANVSGPYQLTIVNGTITLSGTNAFGSLSINAAAGAVASYPNLTAFGGGGPLVSSGTAQLNGNSLTVANLSGGAAGVVENGLNALAPALFTVGTDNHVHDFFWHLCQICGGANAVSLTTTGAGVLTIAGELSSFIGNLAVDGGTLQVAAANNGINSTATPLGNTQLATRTITVNGGAVLQLTRGNTLGGSNAANEAVLTPIVINDGGLVTSTANFNNIIGPVTLSGGTLGGDGGASAGFYTYQLSGGSITVTTAPSLMTASGNNAGFNLATVTTFNVAATGGPGPDLIVSAPLGDRQNNLGAATLVNIGPGWMQLAASNSYSGGTFVENGLLQLGNSAALGSGVLAADGGTLDLAGYSVATCPASAGAAAGTVTDSGGRPGHLGQQSKAARRPSGGSIQDGISQTALAMTGSGTLYLTGSNTYTGGTTVAGDATLIVTSPESIDATGAGTNLSVGSELGLFSAVQPAEQTASASPVAPVPEPATWALLAAGICSLAIWRRRSRGAVC